MQATGLIFSHRQPAGECERLMSTEISPTLPTINQLLDFTMFQHNTRFWQPVYRASALFLIAEDSSLPAFSARAELGGDLVVGDGFVDHGGSVTDYPVAVSHQRASSRYSGATSPLS